MTECKQNRGCVTLTLVCFAEMLLKPVITYSLVVPTPATSGIYAS